MLSSTKKKYMFIIYELGNTGQNVRSVDIAKALAVKKASVSLMLPRLIEEGLIERTQNGSITFTPERARFAANLYLQYLTLYQFFKEKLGGTHEAARQDAICCLCSLTEEATNGMTDYILAECS